jgi:hypothetical protein
MRTGRPIPPLSITEDRRGAHRSVRELETAIKSCLEITNPSPKPFVWTKTADEILDSLARFCARTSGSGR